MLLSLSLRCLRRSRSRSIKPTISSRSAPSSTVSVIVGAIVARLNELRERVRRSRLARLSSRMRVDQRVARRRRPARRCRRRVRRARRPLRSRVVRSPCGERPAGAERSSYGRPLQPYELATPSTPSTSGLSAAFDRARLDAEAREHRVAAEIDRSRASFLAAMTHDLRTPLATIKAANAALARFGRVDGARRSARSARRVVSRGRPDSSSS